MDEAQWRELMAGLRQGDRRSAQQFCERYSLPLFRIAEKHLPNAVRRRVGPEDVAQSACRTFLRRVEGGEFQLEDSDSLWHLLCAIAMTKVREQTRFHLRQKRGLDREQGDGGSSGTWIDAVAPEPTPAEAAEFADQFRELMSSLDDEERQVIEWKLQELTHEQVAEKMGCSERTVRRLMKRVQAQLTRLFEVA